MSKKATIKRKYQRLGITKDISPLWIHGCRVGASTNLGKWRQDISGVNLIRRQAISSLT